MNHLIISFSIIGVTLVRLAHATFGHTHATFVAGHSLNLLFNHGTQRLSIHDLFTPNTLINVIPNRYKASEMSDLGADHLFIVGRLEVVDEPLNHLIFHHGGCTCAASLWHLQAYSRHLCGQSFSLTCCSTMELKDSASMTFLLLIPSSMRSSIGMRLAK